ncbi:hypothetical protein, partial [Xylella fastidiosa]|uniref:hypothetical protein n=1 Tax=Xylella fastidiosa TaxID=2371 RepID=UPI001E5CA208
PQVSAHKLHRLTLRMDNALRAPALWAFAHTALRQPKFYQGPRDVQLRQITVHLLAIQKIWASSPP